jgi:4-hydroxybenzoate polyprenyltransferase/phosphoserine phosphatase
MPLPLYVDLDGTLIATDSLWESLLIVLKRRPWDIVRIPVWLMRGKAGFKAALAEGAELDVEGLPYRDAVLVFIREQKARGSSIVLATAAHESIAKRVADHLGCFDDVLATQKTNLAGSAKAERIQLHARGPFSYVGDHRVDLPVWKAAHERVLVSLDARKEEVFVTELGAPFHTVIRVEKTSRLRSLSRALRVHQWVKNLLLLVPLILAHRFADASSWRRGVIAFFAFSFTASSIYLINDLFDLSSDRRHPRKRFRPMAHGDLSIPFALASAVVCLSLALGGAWLFVSPTFVGVLLGYILTTCVYTLALKRVPVVDVLALAFFYVYRLFAGAVAVSVVLTPWLLAFAAFVFVSLGCLKRVGELTLLRGTDAGVTHSGRGYAMEDLSMMALFGVNAGFLSVLVLALYLNSVFTNNA